MRAFLLVCGAVIAALPFSACTGDSDSGDHLQVVSVSGPDGPLESFSVALIGADGVLWRGICGAPGEAPCDEGLLSLPESVDYAEVVVKAPGHASASFGVEAVSGDVWRAELAGLKSPIVTADYVTGLTAEQGLDDLVALGRVAQTELGAAHSIKFLITEFNEAPTVYFQNTQKHPLHYDFATKVLGIAMNHLEFGQATYVGEDRTMCAGTLVYYPDLTISETAVGQPLDSPVTVNFFPSDNLSPRLALRGCRLIEERLGFPVLAESEGRLAYHPAGSGREEQLLEERGIFASWDMPWLLHKELYAGIDIQLLNPGIAYGTLRVMSPEELESTVVSWTDVLVLSRLPNMLPLVGGTITEELQTPLSHVNVAAHDRGTPNMALPEAANDPRVKPFIGKFIRLEVAAGEFSLTEATLSEAGEYWSESAKQPFVPESEMGVEGLLGFEDISFLDWLSFGVKAANLAELFKLMPDNAPAGFGVPFYYYDQHLSTGVVTTALCHEAKVDCLEEGRAETACSMAFDSCESGAGGSLWDYIDLLLPEDTFKTDTAYRDATLDGLVHLISHSPIEEEFGQELDSRVSEVFGESKVRLRSSTNAEDLQGFSGAGLYNSVSAWAVGPDRASSRIRKVWASVWTFRAYEERAFWKIDHRAVRMGLAVHQAFANEAANGVLITQNIVDPNVLGMYVNVQLGETSVTNPTNGATPEVFTMFQGPSGTIDVARKQFSSLSPQIPVLTAKETTTLHGLAMQSQMHFAALYGESPGLLALDIEFKVSGPKRTIFLKQARPYSLF